eukprot:TRINITY_DN19127_c0_g2_i1.p1 TRINITY_DN19127_c0_g2~~TRINITY_DN19127_c0_g2_i1.p1  ORF type:complete len:193 (+),score=25.23 TRINITY_DN19127_c0_g2_i1:85-663(+)
METSSIMKDIQQLASMSELSPAAAEVLLKKCEDDVEFALECFFEGEFTREELELEVAQMNKSLPPACQYFWNGHCPSGDRCSFRHTTGGENNSTLFTQDTSSMEYEDLLELQSSMGGSVTLPVDSCTRKRLKTVTRKNSKHSSHTCVICIEDITRNDVLVELPCKHSAFHRSCINKWMDTSKRCPVCKADIC